MYSCRFFFFKQKTAYEMRISDWSSDVCSSDLRADERAQAWLEPLNHHPTNVCISAERSLLAALDGSCRTPIAGLAMLSTGDALHLQGLIANPDGSAIHEGRRCGLRSEEHTSELQSLMRRSYAVFCLKKKKN